MLGYPINYCGVWHNWQGFARHAVGSGSGPAALWERHFIGEPQNLISGDHAGSAPSAAYWPLVTEP